MKPSLIYKLWKEGKIEATKEEMSKLWKFYEGLKSFNQSDRKFLDGYKFICSALLGEDEEERENALAHIRRMIDSLNEGYRPIN